MDSDKSCSANFELVQRALTIESSVGGKVTGPGIDCGDDCGQSYLHGTDVALTATPINGYRFVSWSGSCAGNNGNTSVLMDANKLCRASFEPIRRTLSVESGVVLISQGYGSMPLNQ